MGPYKRTIINPHFRSLGKRYGSCLKVRAWLELGLQTKRSGMEKDVRRTLYPYVFPKDHLPQRIRIVGLL